MRHRNFRLFATGQLISLIGTWMQNVAQSWLVYRLTHSEFLLGAAGFCAYFPVLLLGPVAGLAADRFPRQRIVVVTQSLFMLQAFVLAALTLSGKVTVTQVLVLAAVLGSINAFDVPARQSLMIHMAGKDDLLNAISLNSVMFNAARVVGPSLAGLVVAALGEGACFLLNGVSFIALIACVLAMRFPPLSRTVEESPLSHLLDGFRYAWRTRAVRTLLGLSAAVNIAIAPAFVLAPFFADALFHRGSRGLGFLTGAMGLGAVAGTLGLASRTEVSGLRDVALTSTLTLGIALAGLAWSPFFWLALVVMPVVGFGFMRQNAATNTLIQTIIPDEYRGRTMALYSMTVIGMLPVGSLAAGGLAASFGPRITVSVGAVLCLLAGAWYQVRTGRAA